MSPAEIELLLRKVLGEGFQLHPLAYLVMALVTILSGGIGAFSGAYLRRRAENLATKADFDSLLTQLRQQTREVEEIKSEISQAGWIHQRRWDLKRQLYAELLVVLEEIREKGRWINESSSYYFQATPDLSASLERFAAHMHERSSIDRFLAAKALAGIFLAPAAVAALDDLSRDYQVAADTIAHSNNVAETVIRHGDYVHVLVQSTERAYEAILAEAQQDLMGVSRA